MGFLVVVFLIFFGLVVVAGIATAMLALLGAAAVAFLAVVLFFALISLLGRR